MARARSGGVLLDEVHRRALRVQNALPRSQVGERDRCQVRAENRANLLPCFGSCQTGPERGVKDRAVNGFNHVSHSDRPWRAGERAAAAGSTSAIDETALGQRVRLEFEETPRQAKPFGQVTCSDDCTRGLLGKPDKQAERVV